MKEAIRSYLLEEFLVQDGIQDLADDTPLLSSGLLDSVALEQLLLFMEEEFGIRFEESDYSVDNFETLEALDRLVRRKAAPIGGSTAAERGA